MALDMVDPAGRLQERRSKLARREEGQDGLKFPLVFHGRSVLIYLFRKFAPTLKPAKIGSLQ
jgi:hypothetical protein